MDHRIFGPALLCAGVLFPVGGLLALLYEGRYGKKQAVVGVLVVLFVSLLVVSIAMILYVPPPTYPISRWRLLTPHENEILAQHFRGEEELFLLIFLLMNGSIYFFGSFILLTLLTTIGLEINKRRAKALHSV